METDQQFNARRLRAAKLEAVQRRLRGVKRAPLRLTDVLDAIRAEGLPAFKTRDAMLRRGLLVFLGEHAQDQRYMVG